MEQKPFTTIYNSQEVIDNAYKHAYQLLEHLQTMKKEEKPDWDAFLLNLKNLLFYLEDYAYWKD